MNIEEFYDEDPRRRSSAELELGRDWHDAHGVRYELSWVEDTGELYDMREPVPSGWDTPFGGVHVTHAHSIDEQEISEMTVAVLGVIRSRAEVDEVVSGWEEVMGSPNSIDWLVGRLRQAGLLGAPPGRATATTATATRPAATAPGATAPATTA